MKLEFVDAIMAVLIIFFLAAYVKLGAPAFLYVVVVLIVAEIFVNIRFRKEKVKENESMP